MSTILQGLRPRATGVAALAVLCCLLLAAAALAASDHYFSGGLSPGRSYASGSVHPGVTFSSASTDHTACASVSQGWSGYAPPGSGTIKADTAGCGINPSSFPGAPSGSWHGWVGNPNAATNVSVSDSHYSW